MLKSDFTVELVRQALDGCHDQYTTSAHAHRGSGDIYLAARPAAIIAWFRESAEWLRLSRPIPRLTADDFRQMGLTVIKARRLDIYQRSERIYGRDPTEVVVRWKRVLIPHPTKPHLDTFWQDYTRPGLPMERWYS